jgi:Na+-translocating ferredoxin:NAD+ oxidoreductase RNF subunit RnfB
MNDTISLNPQYELLADELNKIPNGFPRTESGVELKLLAKLFNDEDAALASSLSMDPKSLQEIAEQNNLSEPEAKQRLIGMVKRGLIDIKREEGIGFTFHLIPFVVGFYERQNAKIDKEFAELFEQYYHESFHKTMLSEPSVHRIIPLEKAIPVDIDVMPYEKASNYLDQAQSWGVLDCICRVQKKLIGQGCKHSVRNCLVFSPKPGAFNRSEDIDTLTREEAMKVLADADREGLVHSVNNAQSEVYYVCNCCTCSCGVLRGMVEYGSENSIARSDFYAAVDPELCTGCESCIERCQFNAMNMVDGICEVDRVACYGCGLCISSCETEALSLVQKSTEERVKPPADDAAWREKRAELRID